MRMAHLAEFYLVQSNMTREYAMEFYAYIHCKPCGMPFYIGKGAKNRSIDFVRRSAWHKSIVAKYGIVNITVREYGCDSEEAALHLERMLIRGHRYIGHDLCNMTNGGEGTSGLKRSAESIAKTSAANRGRKLSIETRAKIGAANLGRVKSAETRAKLSDSHKGKKHTQESILKMSAARIGIKRSPDTIRKSAIGHKGKKLSVEHREKISKAGEGMVVSADTRKKISEALKGKKKTPEHIEKSASSHRGKKHTTEHFEKIRATKKLRADMMVAEIAYGASLGVMFHAREE